jgi:hypothetical protein
MFEGMKTSAILKIIFSNLRKYRPSVKYQIDLRKSLSLMRPQTYFELFVGMLLKEHGYIVTMNQIVPDLEMLAYRYQCDVVCENYDISYVLETSSSPSCSACQPSSFYSYRYYQFSYVEFPVASGTSGMAIGNRFS